MNTYDSTGWYGTAQGTWWHPSLNYPGHYVISPNDHSPICLAVVDDFGTLVITQEYPL